MDSVDADTNKARLENELAELTRIYESVPIQTILRASSEAEEALVSMICNQTPRNIETLVAHFEMIGELRGVRRLKGIFENTKADIEEALKENK